MQMFLEHVKTILLKQAKATHWKTRAKKHDVEELHEGISFECVKVVLQRTHSRIWTSKHMRRNMSLGDKESVDVKKGQHDIGLADIIIANAVTGKARESTDPIPVVHGKRKNVRPGKILRHEGWIVEGCMEVKAGSHVVAKTQ